MNRVLKQGVAVLFGYGLAAVVFIFLGRVIYHNWETLSHQNVSIRWPFLFLASAAGFLNIVSHYYIYRLILIKNDPALEVSHKKLFGVFIYSWLARYVPGKVWLPLGKVYLGVREGIDKGSLVLSSFFEMVLSTLSQLLATIVAFLIFFRYLYPPSHLFVILLIAGTLFVFFVIQRPILGFLTKRAFEKVVKSEMSPQSLLSYKEMLKIICYYFVPTLLVSLSFLCMTVSVIDISPSYYPAIVGSYAVANFLAKVTLITPAGLGVKEGILAGLLSPLMSLPLAIGATVASRLLFVGVDIFTFILYKAYGKISLSR
jgi:uncharacterized membrane protein YbhN (UPF0104 family)